MNQLLTIATALIGFALGVVNVRVETAKRTINRWLRELGASGKIQSPEASELGTMYSFNFFSNWTIEIDSKNKFRTLRNVTIRQMLRDYKSLRKVRNILALIFSAFVGLALVVFIVSH